MSFTSKDLDQAVDKLFEKYDKDKNGLLDKNQLTEFIQATYKKMGRPNPTNAQVINIIKLYDKNFDGKIEKKQLKAMLQKTLGAKVK